MTKFIPAIICSLVLLRGGIIDYKTRIIPNYVPIALIGIGLFTQLSLFEHIIGLLIPAIVLLASSGLAKTDLPGGDFKLLCSLGFCIGLTWLLILLVLALIFSLIYGACKRLAPKRNIPLCTYMAISYMAYLLAGIGTVFA